MAEAMRFEEEEQVFAVDLTKVAGLAVSRALTHADTMTGGTNAFSKPLAEREGAADYFTYSWLKAIAAGLGELDWPVESAHILPSTVDGDALITDLVLITENCTAALDLVCSNIESHYKRAAQRSGFVSATIKVHVLTKDEAKRGHALMGGTYSPALQIWP